MSGVQAQKANLPVRWRRFKNLTECPGFVVRNKHCLSVSTLGIKLVNRKSQCLIAEAESDVVDVLAIAVGEVRDGVSESVDVSRLACAF